MVAIISLEKEIFSILDIPFAKELPIIYLCNILFDGGGLTSPTNLSTFIIFIHISHLFL